MPYSHLMRVMTALVATVGFAACTTPTTPTTPTTTTRIGTTADVISNDLSCALPTNCAATVGNNAIAPLHFKGTVEDGLTQLRATIASFPEAKITRAQGPFVEAVFTTRAGFTDTVLFRVDATEKKIDFRSRSNFGLFDFGKNKSRMTEIASRFTQYGSSSRP